MLQFLKFNACMIFVAVEKTSCISEMKNTLSKHEKTIQDYEKTIQNVNNS